jgi:kynurenine formamidase
VITDPPFMRPKITYQSHKDTVAEASTFFPGIAATDFPDAAGFAAAEWVTLTTHHGTHLDAPWHFHPTMDHGKPAITIDEVPLDWCFRPGVKLDFRHFPDGYVVTDADVESELKRIGCGMGYRATMYLLERGVRLTGTDAWSWDAPFKYTAQRVAETGDRSLIWEGHKAGRDIGYCHLEKLHNLEALPPFGYTVSKGASAGWTRAVAIFEP